jgi:GT2 family glycosyltransferase
VNHNKRVNPFVSVIVVTLARKKTELSSCLRSLSYQTYDKFEVVIVVSKNKASIAEKIVAKLGLANVKIFIEESTAGISKARNFGIKNSQGQTIMFLDDDAVAKPSWIENMVRCGFVGNTLAATGRVLPLSEEVHPLISFLGSNYDQGNQIKFTNLIIGCNMAFKRKLFSVIGYFDETIDYGGDEVELASRLLSKGHKILYVPQAIVRHDLSPNLTTLIKQSYVVGKHSSKFQPVFSNQKLMQKTRIAVEACSYTKSITPLFVLPAMMIARRFGSFSSKF